MNTRRKFYFNTGVRPANSPKLSDGEVWRGGVKQVPFECDDVPENARFMFACNDPNLPEAQREGVIVREIFNSALVSKYAYFAV